MRFCWITMQNFLCFGNTQYINLANRGLTVVLGRNLDANGAGSNGAGKSSFLEAIVWALYGKTMRKYNADDVVNNKKKKNCVVTLCVEDGGVEFLIERTRKYSNKNTLKIFRDGELIELGTKSQTQEVITELVGMSFETFCQSVLMWHGKRSFADMTDSDQKAVLEDILQVDKLQKARKKVGEKVRTLQAKIASKTGELNSLSDRIADVNQLINVYTRDSREFSTLQRQKKFKTLSKKAEIQGKIEELYNVSGLTKLLKESDALRDQLDDIENELNQLDIKKIEIRDSFKFKKDKFKKKEVVTQHKINELTTNIARATQNVGTICDSCKQVLSPDVATEFIETWNAEVYKLQPKLAEYVKAQGSLETKEQKSLKDVSLREAKLYADRKTLQGKVQINASNIAKKSADLNKIEQLEDHLASLNKELADQVKAQNPYKTLIDTSLNKAKDLKRRYKIVEYSIKSLEIETKHLLYWQQAFSNQGIKSYMFDNVLPFLTEKAQEYLDILTDGDITIEFATQSQTKKGEWRDKFQVKAVNSNGADVYHGNSDGERSRIDFAVGWALADLAASRALKSVKFRGLDEPFVHIDSEGEDQVIKLLNKVVPKYETVMCVTHSTHLQDQFPNEIVIEKKKFSRVVDSEGG